MLALFEYTHMYLHTSLPVFDDAWLQEKMCRNAGGRKRKEAGRGSIWVEVKARKGHHMGRVREGFQAGPWDHR